MRVIRPVARLVNLVFLCASLALAQGPSPTPAPRASGEHLATIQPTGPSTVSSQYVPRQKVLIIADNQEHLLTGGPLKSSSGLTDRYVTSVALRSPLANVGGRLLMREALRFGREQGAGLVLHLGDAADVSCPDELSSVFNALDEETPGKMWFMAPGNHDGLLVGNFAGYQEPLGDNVRCTLPFYNKAPEAGYGDIPRKWINACLSPSNYKDQSRADILTRGDAIRLYVDRLKRRQGASWPQQPEIEFIDMVGPRGTTIQVTCMVEKIDIESHGYSAIARICPRKMVPGDPKKHWVGAYASFIVQKLDVEGIRIVLLDTSDYPNATEVSNVLFHGELSKAQRKRAKVFFKSADGREIDRRKVIVAGHHPFAQIPAANRKWIAERSGRYISAHVHASASLIRHRAGGRELAELNVGSTLDFPPQAVVASIGSDLMEFRVAGADVLKTHWHGFLSECVKNEKEWMLKTKKLYTDYRRGLYVKHLLAALRKADALRVEKFGPSARRLTIPADEDVDGWRLLDDALQEINKATGDSRTFWACQAYYASKEAAGEKGFLGETFVPAFGFLLEPLLGEGFKRGSEVTGGWLPFSSP